MFPNPPRRGLTAEELDQVTTTTTDRLRKMVDRLDRSDWQEGMAWYFEAHSIAQGIGRLYGCGVTKAAGVIATLSPRIAWETNVDEAREIFEYGEDWGYVSLRRNVDKALWLTEPEVDNDYAERLISGRKVRAFYRNIRYPATSLDVTLDGWMYDALNLPVTDNGNPKYLERRGVYDAISDGFRIVAADHGILPHQLQAAIWLSVRSRKDK